MDTRQLKTLLAIAQHRTFAEAAKAVNLTPSAISQQVRALEMELDTELFDRTKRPATLNAKGLQLLETARLVLDIVDETKSSISGERVAGTLTIGSVRTSTIAILPRAIKALCADYPDLRIKLHVDLSEALLNDVVAGRLDLAVVAEHADIPPALTWTPFLREPLIIIAPDDAPALAPHEMIAKLPYIRYRSSVPLARQIDAELNRLSLEPDNIAEVDTIPVVVEFVKAGLGVSVVPHIAVQSVGSEGLRVAAFGRPPAFRRIGIVSRMNSPRVTLIKAFHETLARLSGPFGEPAAD